jgi:Icc-related predicted phosphoesterase
MKIACISDIHENLIHVPEADILLIAGDISYAFKGNIEAKERFLVKQFAPWLKNANVKAIAWVAGNHDQSIEQNGIPEELKLDSLGIHYLQDNGIEILGKKIWGTPWQPWFYSWAFNAPEINGEEFLAEKFNKIPEDTDIIICHGPPFGYGDNPGHELTQPNVGSHAMTETLQRVNPELMVCGHIHAGYGGYQMSECDTYVVNAAIVNNKYQAVNKPIVMDI